MGPGGPLFVERDGDITLDPGPNGTNQYRSGNDDCETSNGCPHCVHRGDTTNGATGCVAHRNPASEDATNGCKGG